MSELWEHVGTFFLGVSKLYIMLQAAQLLPHVPQIATLRFLLQNPIESANHASGGIGFTFADR